MEVDVVAAKVTRYLTTFCRKLGCLNEVLVE
jgi:hypothetical protein